MKKIQQLRFNNTYAKLPAIFHSKVCPSPLSNSHLLHLNQSVADLLEIDSDSFKQNLHFFTGQQVHHDMQPLAQCYSGHQFGSYVSRLGDGRAILLGEIETELSGRWDLQLKGAGTTPYSRDGDGRAVLRSTIREYLCSEAMAGLGIPTTRALCIIGSDEDVYREQIEKGALLLRTAPSHVRFGTFEYYFYNNLHDETGILTDYVIDHHYPHLRQTDNPVVGLLEQVTQKTAHLIAQWQAVGFAHGVMNSDNMSILGLTLDYGPFGFLDAYDPDYICNHSDYHGRYAFKQQAETGLFNLSCLAQALLPVLADTPERAVELAKQTLEQYQPIFIQHYATLMRGKLGLQTMHDDDQSLVQSLQDLMSSDRVDHTLFFRRLCDLRTHDGDNSLIRDMFIQREQFDMWAQRYLQRLQHEDEPDSERQKRMRTINPKYILRNYMAEVAIQKAQENDFSEVERLFDLLKNPFDEQPDNHKYADFPPEWAQQISVSCSS